MDWTSLFKNSVVRTSAWHCPVARGLHDIADSIRWLSFYCVNDHICTTCALKKYLFVSSCCYTYWISYPTMRPSLCFYLLTTALLHQLYLSCYLLSLHFPCPSTPFVLLTSLLQFHLFYDRVCDARFQFLFSFGPSLKNYSSTFPHQYY